MAKKNDYMNQMFGDGLSFATKEAYKKLRVNLQIALSDENSSHVIGVTSAQPSEGKSTTALNIAFSFAEGGKKVLLIDADMRRASLHDKLGLENEAGLSDLLTRTNSVSSVIKNYSNEDGTVSFSILTGGSLPENPSELLNSQRMARLMDVLRNAYDLVILDLPPVGAVIDAVSVAKNTDGMVVVIREDNCPKSIFTNCIDQLQFAKIKILGFVVNGSTEGTGKKYGYKYGYGDNYGYYSK